MRSTAVVLVAALAAGGAVVLLGSSTRALARSRPAARGSAERLSRLWVAVGSLVGAAVLAWTGAPAGLVLGTVAGLGTAWAGRRWGSSAEPDSAQQPGASDTAVAADLIVAAVGSGVPVTAALEAVGRAVGGSVGAALSASARLDQAGAPPETAYRSLLEQDATARIGRALQQARVSGASPTAVLDGAARAERERRRSMRVSRARGAGSLAAIPVGVLFLPAFVLVAVVPVVVGAIGPVLGSSA